MNFQPETFGGVNAVGAYAPGMLVINGLTWTQSVVLPWQGEILPWAVAGFDALDDQAFAALGQLAPELVVFGSGGRLRFPRPALLRPLIERGIGVETMDTAAACRTYNVLASEGRRVVAGLLLPPA